jgi:prepilin-type processing-associated H-X9-DG protein
LPAPVSRCYFGEGDEEGFLCGRLEEWKNGPTPIFQPSNLPVIRCVPPPRAEYRYQANNGPVASNYETPFIQTSYAINFSFSYYDTSYGRKAFGRRPEFAELHAAPMVMDCVAWNPGWHGASFNWHVDDTYWSWDPLYPYRHPGRTANILFMDGHVDKARSYVLGEGPRIYSDLYSTTPCGTPYLGTSGCP